MNLMTKYALCYATCVCALATTNSVHAEVSEKLKPFHTNFVAADADKSGGLNAEEFKVLIDANAEQNLGKAKMIQKRKAYARAFGKMDKNKDQQVTWAEIESMASEKR
jgi:hypothetical protein